MTTRFRITGRARSSPYAVDSLEHSTLEGPRCRNPTPSPAPRCGASAPVPEDRDHRSLWDAGWRWIGSQGLFSCPDCPPVLVVDRQGRHLRGPGAEPSLITTTIEDRQVPAVASVERLTAEAGRAVLAENYAAYVAEYGEP